MGSLASFSRNPPPHRSSTRSAYVRFRYQDYRDGQSKVMTLEGPEFLRRFLQHVLPHGFMRTRHFGWLANACRKQQLPLVRQAIAALAVTPAVIDKAMDTASVPGFEGIPVPVVKPVSCGFVIPYGLCNRTWLTFDRIV